MDTKRITGFLKILAFVVLGISRVVAQPVNDNCDKAIEIIDVTSFCSKIGATGYTNQGATDSGYGSATCFSNDNADVWYKFTAIATDVAITVVGDQPGASAGTLKQPQVALYYGKCGGTLNELNCGSNATAANIVQIYEGGLQPGQEYLIRIDSRSVGNAGSFQLCLNNYNPPVKPGQDCPIASVLCDKSPFVVKQVLGGGANPDEAASSCLAGIGGSLSESSSTWFTWICDQAGTLTFTLTPLNKPDDIDFAVYELPNGIKNCSGKVLLRCNATAPPCAGPTGLNLTDPDITEDLNCNAGENGYCKYIDMEAGKAYALVVNNFSNTGIGFQVEFGGTGTFRGPQADIKLDKDKICYGETVTISDNSSFPLGKITSWSWSFGDGADPVNSKQQGPHNVQFNTTGKKSVVLTITSDLGCVVTDIDRVEVDTCCDGKNQVTASGTQKDLLCADILDGNIDVNANSILPIGYAWSNGSQSQDLNNLGAGDYSVTLTNEAGCRKVMDFTITSPPLIEIDTQIVKPTCNGGKDGSVTLAVQGGVSPYQFDWKDGKGFTSNNTFGQLSNGIYPVSVKDGNGCLKNLNIRVQELELELDPQVQAIFPPSCFGFSDGSILVDISNGLSPYQYDFGGGWVSANSLNNIPAGNYTVQVQDQNLCKGLFTFEVGQPEALATDLSVTDALCFGISNGSISATASGGTAPYSFLWSNGKFGDVIEDLGAGVYLVTLTDQNGCTLVDNALVQQPAELLAKWIAKKDVVCFGDASGVLVVDAQGGSPGYEFSLDGFLFDADTVFRDLTAGDYVVSVMDANGCIDTFRINIEQPPQLLVNAGPDVVIELGESATVDALVSPPGTEVAILWEPPSSVSCSDCFTTELRPLFDSKIQVTVTDSSGCKASDELQVFVTKERRIFIPNAISPNGDGFNDVLHIYGDQSAEVVLVFRIYNRWGGQVYEGRDLPINSNTTGWDGRFRGEYLNPGVFAYYAEVRFIDGEVVRYTGDVTVVR